MFQATTDLYGNCTLRHSGTSAAAPEAAGVFALALEAKYVRHVRAAVMSLIIDIGVNTTVWEYQEHISCPLPVEQFQLCLAFWAAVSDIYSMPISLTSPVDLHSQDVYRTLSHYHNHKWSEKQTTIKKQGSGIFVSFFTSYHFLDAHIGG